MDVLPHIHRETPARVSHAKTVHWTVLAPILRFAMLGISRSAERDLGRRPKTLQP